MPRKPKRSSAASPHWFMKTFLLLILSVIIVAGIVYFTGMTPDSIDEAFASIFGDAPASAPDASTPTTDRPEFSDDYSGVLPEKGKLTVTVLDVGQADCIIVVSPSGKTMLVDAGLSSTTDRVDAYLDAAGITEFDVVVATHPHSDHIGGMATLLREHGFGSIYMPKLSHDSQTYQDLIDAIREKDKKAIAAEPGVEIPLDDKLTIQILAPVKDDYDSLNDYSAVVRIDYNNSSFLLTGDAEMISEMDMVSEHPELLNVDVLKVGHHGSSTSSTEAFLDAVSPDYAVISVGADNSYGHPNDSVIEALEERDCHVYRTDQNGTVAIVTDGKNFVIKSQW